MWVPNLPITILSTVTASTGAIFLFKDFYSGPPFDRKVRADDLTVVVTGANTGIGRELTHEFANRGAKVFMACRDMEKCETARRDIVLETGNKFVYCRPCDLASLDSVRRFVARFKSEEPRLHVLVNNAGVMEPPRDVTADGFERQLGVNHLGHFLLTNLLLDTLKESAPSRVVAVTCGAHRRGRIHKEDPSFTRAYDAAAAHAQSKLAVVLFARELGRRLMMHGVAVSAVDPGLTDSKYSRHLPLASSVTRFLLYPLFWPFMKNCRSGAQPVLHAALADDTNDAAGDLYVDMKKCEPSAEGQDYDLGLWLWRLSEKWTRLDEHKAQLDRERAAA